MIKLFNTLSKRIEVFKSIDEEVKIYLLTFNSSAYFREFFVDNKIDVI